MNGIKVTIRYARVLYAVAVEKGVLEAVAEGLSRMTSIMTQEPRIRDYCLKRHADPFVEMNFIDIAFIPYVSDLTAAVLKTAVKNGRLSALPYLSAAFQQIRDEESGITEVAVESVSPIEETLQNELETRMGTRLGKEIRLNSRAIPELLAGIRILWNNRMIDLSAAGRLKRLRSIIKTA